MPKGGAILSFLWRRRNIEAIAIVRGGPLAPDIIGEVYFIRDGAGTLVEVELRYLPPYRPGNEQDPIGPHGFHIHEVGTCQIGDPDEPFLAAGEHWSPDQQPHGNHAGDLPNLFSRRQGYSYMIVYTDRFIPEEVIGRTVIIHEHPNDFRTQPVGAAGRRLACGIIKKY